jgi:2-methylisocitrate lyase-like PEP mutase family enzyme
MVIAEDERTGVLRRAVTAKEIAIVPGLHDPLSARVLEGAGAAAGYISGATFSYGQLASPDLNLATASEMSGHIRRVRSATGLPLIADGDTGFGGVLNVERTVRDYVLAGANAVQLEDQVQPKRCGHLHGREVVSPDEMTGRILAAQHIQEELGFLLIGRTDARTSHGLGEVIERAKLFERLDVDLIFPESLETEDEYRAVRNAVNTPLMANMVEGGRSPDLTAATLQKLGYQLVIFPGSATRSYVKTLRDVYHAIVTLGSSASVRDGMLPFSEMQGFLGTEYVVHHGSEIDAAIRRISRPPSATVTAQPA